MSTQTLTIEIMTRLIRFDRDRRTLILDDWIESIPGGWREHVRAVLVDRKSEIDAAFCGRPFTDETKHEVAVRILGFLDEAMIIGERLPSFPSKVWRA